MRPVGPLAGAASGPGTPTKARRPHRASVVATLSVAGLCGGCAGGLSLGVGYRGTGTLQGSGAIAQSLATQQVVFSSCRDLTVEDEETATIVTSPDLPTRRENTFSVLTIGDGCWIDGDGYGAGFFPVAGRLCRLHFPEGDRVLRVTDFTGHYGRTGSDIEFALGGDDVRTGLHALYRFAGRAVTPDTKADCDALNRKRRGAFAQGQGPELDVREPTNR